MKAQEVYRGNGPLVVLLSYHVNVADFRLVQGTGPEIPATVHLGRDCGPLIPDTLKNIQNEFLISGGVCEQKRVKCCHHPFRSLLTYYLISDFKTT